MKTYKSPWYFMKTASIFILIIVGMSACQQEPSASFYMSSTAIDEGDTVLFQNFSFDAESYKWDFGDGTGSIEENPMHVYDTAGIYIVSLTASSKKEKKTVQVSKSIKVGDIPIASFSVSDTSIAVGGDVLFTNNSLNNPKTWLWDFGDGTTAIIETPRHIYNSADVFTVSLTVKNIHGETTEVQNELVVVGALTPPTVNFKQGIGCACNPFGVQFTDLSKSLIETWLWDFGDGNTSTEKDYYHTYNGGGTYTVSLKVSNAAGVDSLTKVDFVNIIHKDIP